MAYGWRDKMESEIPKITVDFRTFKKVYQAIKKTGAKEVTFEYIIGSCFPDIANNIKQELRRQYTIGYTEGLQDAEVQKFHIKKGEEITYEEENIEDYQPESDDVDNPAG